MQVWHLGGERREGGRERGKDGSAASCSGPWDQAVVSTEDKMSGKPFRKVVGGPGVRCLLRAPVVILCCTALFPTGTLSSI